MSFLICAAEVQGVGREKLADTSSGIREVAKQMAGLLETIDTCKNDPLLRIALPAAAPLAWVLQQMLNHLEKHLLVAPKPGQEAKALQSEFLVLASEFVKLRLREYYDAVIAHLYDLIAKNLEASKLGRPKQKMMLLCLDRKPRWVSGGSIVAEAQGGDEAQQPNQESNAAFHAAQVISQPLVARYVLK